MAGGPGVILQPDPGNVRGHHTRPQTPPPPPSLLQQLAHHYPPGKGLHLLTDGFVSVFSMIDNIKKKIIYIKCTFIIIFIRDWFSDKNWLILLKIPICMYHLHKPVVCLGTISLFVYYLHYSRI